MFKKHASPKAVMENEYPFYVLIETSGSNKDHDDEVCKMKHEDYTVLVINECLYVIETYNLSGEHDGRGRRTGRCRRSGWDTNP